MHCRRPAPPRITVRRVGDEFLAVQTPMPDQRPRDIAIVDRGIDAERIAGTLRDLDSHCSAVSSLPLVLMPAAEGPLLALGACQSSPSAPISSASRRIPGAAWKAASSEASLKRDSRGAGNAAGQQGRSVSTVTRAGSASRPSLGVISTLQPSSPALRPEAIDRLLEGRHLRGKAFRPAASWPPADRPPSSALSAGVVHHDGHRIGRQLDVDL